MPPCLFCQIAAGNIDADVLRIGELTLAFRDIRPQAPVHVLIIPKEHLANVAELTPEHGPLLVETAGMAKWIAASEGI
ncbi:MAG: histidine triad family protein, partial [Actinomycetota bacterium]|nr:histidine triad family protein [Actinomycetota bacterium]